MSDLVVHDPGPLTTVQDLGRPGYLRVGIPASGPVDADAFVLGNRLVGNADSSAALECTLIGPRVEFTDVRRVAVTGAAVPVALVSKPEFVITHSPGHMFVTDLPNHALAAL